MGQAIIVCDKVSKAFHENVLFTNASITFVQGTSYALQGVSGTGKSTFLSLLGLLDTPTSGTIRYNEQCLELLSPGELNKVRLNFLGYLFQQPYLIKELSVIENIQLPGMLSSADQSSSRNRAKELLEKIKLTHKKKAYPAQLSGGELQRVALARALFNKPAFLIADEPTASLDYKTAHEIVDLLCQIQKEENMGLIISTHDSAIAQKMNEQYELCEQQLIKK